VAATEYQHKEANPTIDNHNGNSEFNY
jgi:hypothetical protein